MNFEKITVKVSVLLQIIAFICFSFLIFLALKILVPYTWLWYTIIWVIGGIYVLTAFLYIPLFYNSLSLGFSNDKIVYKRGVIFHKSEILYKDRIVFITVYNNPLTPFFKISSLIITATGGSMRIFCIDTKRANEIAKQLQQN